VNLLGKSPQFACSAQGEGTFLLTDKKGVSFYIESYRRYILIFQGDKEKAAEILAKIRDRL
jgi:hypothetical protein